MKQYNVKIKFLEFKRPKAYVFEETTTKNPAGQILFLGLPEKGRGYTLHYTEHTLKAMQAELTEYPYKQPITE
jgi:hypothetical protein